MKDARTVPTTVMLGIYVLCFGAGATNHARDFASHGPRPYAAVPLPLELFWSALLLLDLAVVVLLLGGYRRAGLVLAIAIMIVDVGANSYWTYAGGWHPGSALQLQSLFLGFVTGSLPFLWPTAEARSGVGRPGRSA